MVQIEPIVVDTSFKRLGIIGDYSSLIWTTRYYSVGDFELCVDITDKNIELLKKDYYIIREDDENVGVIEDITITFNDDLKEIFIVKGRFVTSILARRVIEKQIQINTTISNGIRLLVMNEAIAPENKKRKIPNLICEIPDFVERLDAQYTGKNLLEVIQGISETYHVGYKITLNDKNEFVFTIYKGVDRSYNQEKNQYVVFSNEYENLLSSEYKESYSSLVTDVLVAGEGEGIDRKTLWVSKNNNSGLQRYECYKDQRNLSTNEGEISAIEYEKQMHEEGLESITSYVSIFNGEAYFGGIEYKKDVMIGDICVVENTRWGIFANSRLVEVIESVGEDGKYTISPTFGV